MSSKANVLARTLCCAATLLGCREQPREGPRGSADQRGPAIQTALEGGASDAPQGGGAAVAGEKVTAEAHAMGTHLAYAAFTTPQLGPPEIRAIFDKATAEIRRIETLMTTWDPASEVSQINAAAGSKPVTVSQETLDVIEESLRASQLSGGAFDITFQTLHGLWKFDEDLDPHPPTQAQVLERLRYLGYKHVKVNGEARSVFLDEPHVRIGLGGIAKGYAVDRASKVLLDAGISSFYVQAGGDLYAQGSKPDGAPWVAGVRDPRGPDGDYFAVIALRDRAFSTAGDYERAYVVGGKRYHHIIDPHTGYPATASRSVTIWAKTALLADEVDDAVFILGPEKGLALVASMDDVGAVIVDAQNRVWISKNLEGRMNRVHAPRDAQ